MSTSITARHGAGPGAWLWFGLWALTGAGLASLISQLAVLTVPASIAAAAVLMLVTPSRPHWPGLGVGAGLLSLSIGLLNLGGPGTVCRTTAQTLSCTEKWSPWPWLGAGLALIVAAVAAEVWRQQRSAPSGEGTASAEA